VGRSSSVMSRVWTSGVRTSPLVPLVSTRRVLQVATTPPVAWTAPFSPWLPLSRAHRWLQMPSFGKPTLPSPSRGHLAGVPPWSPVSWPGLSSLAFLLVLIPKAPPCHADARRGPLLPGLRPETSAVGRAPALCRHSRGRGP